MLDLEALTVQQIVAGYFLDEAGEEYVCVDCGRRFPVNEVFRIGDRFYVAERATQIHIQSDHCKRLADLLNVDSRYLSLTENQRELLHLLSAGLSDQEISARLGISPSTVRHRRFVFREKAKSAKLYLALWEMVCAGLEKGGDSGQHSLVPVHGGATMVDQRYEITEAESRKIIADLFSSLAPLRLKVFPAKEKKKIVVLRQIAQEFERGRQYSEKDVNSILADIYPDFVTIRRYLIQYGYLDRKRDGSAYWVK